MELSLPMTPSAAAESPARTAAPSRPRRALRAFALLALLGAGGGAGWLAFVLHDLPSFEGMLDYRPKEATYLFDAAGQTVAVIADERRTVVRPDEIPLVLKQAIISAEDARFYEHEGLSYPGIARAIVKNAIPGTQKSGASTITQQVVKTFLLSPERTLTRKVREAVLAKRLEENLTKDEILWLYLNQIYFGHRRYGVEEASRLFFDHGVRELTLGEAALLAGLPQSPVRLSPLQHPERAKKRQRYVLGQLLQNGYITQVEHDREVLRPLPVIAREDVTPGPFYVEHVRRLLVEQLGEQAVLTEGLRVHLAMDGAIQRAADEAVRAGLVAHDRRHGYRGALPAPDAELVRTTTQKRAKEAAEATDGRLVLGDLRAGRTRVAKPGLVLGGLVVQVGPKEALLDLGGAPAKLYASGAAWAGKPLPELLQVGRLALVSIARLGKEGPELELWQEPEAEAALVSIEPGNRRVRALVGGFDAKRSSFDRATQAKRQPGSAFKPFVYGAALESRRWTAASLVADAPETIRDPWTGKEWRPQNYDRSFEGTITLRRAVAGSKNTVPVRLAQELGPAAAIDFAKRAGVSSPQPENLTVALGTGELSPLELCDAYATIAAGGLHGAPVFVERVVARDGRVLLQADGELRPAIDPAVAYVLTHLLRAVIEEGTGRGAAELARPVAGKTGTTSDGTDAWFAGFTPALATVSWVGFDDAQRKLGRGEAGGRTALPAWLDVMRAAHSGKSLQDFPVPEGIELVAIDPASGLRAPEGAPSERVPFLAGTAPTETALEPGGAGDDAAAAIFLEETQDAATP